MSERHIPIRGEIPERLAAIEAAMRQTQPGARQPFARDAEALFARWDPQSEDELAQYAMLAPAIYDLTDPARAARVRTMFRRHGWIIE